MRRLGSLGVIAIPYLLLVIIEVPLTGTTARALAIGLGPTIRFWLVAAALGLPYIMGVNIFERLLARLAPAPPTWWRALLFSWLVVLVAIGTLNLVVAFTAGGMVGGIWQIRDVATWVNVSVFGLMGLFWIAGLVLVYMHFGRRPVDLTSGVAMPRSVPPVAEATEPEPPSAKGPESLGEFCPSCFEFIGEDVSVCRYCGHIRNGIPTRTTGST